MKIKSIKGTVTHSSPGKKPVSRKIVLTWNEFGDEESAGSGKKPKSKRRKAS